MSNFIAATVTAETRRTAKTANEGRPSLGEGGGPWHESGADVRVDDQVDALVSELPTDPKHFFRSFTVKELGHLMTVRPAEPAVRAHEMGIYKRYFDLIVTGRETTEIRVDDSSRKKIKVGSLIRGRCQGDTVLTRVTAVSRYASFEEMFDHQDVVSVNPVATREDQLANIRQIYPPEREALGVVAIGIELVDSPRPEPA
jgi:ASC-1-like (ASCH) protein